MCGRYALVMTGEILELPFVEESEFPAIEIPWKHYNVCPATTAPIVTNGGCLRPALWGLIPHWSKTPPSRPLFNARLETAAEKPSFREAWKKQRCAVPTSGFFEWKTEGKQRIPFYFAPVEDHRLLWLAGLASHWTSPDGDRRWTYSILTESSGGSMVEEIHHRQPVMLAQGDVRAWLTGAGEVPSSREKLRSPYQVSQKVNSAANDSPENIEPVRS